MTITGTIAPEDFSVCESFAEEAIHAATVYAYVGKDIDALPEAISSRLKKAVALQTLFISQQGGVDGLAETEPSGMSLGRFSYSGGDGSGASGKTTVPDTVTSMLPILVAYGRGMRACAPCR